jgi:hypothetical protein
MITSLLLIIILELFLAVGVLYFYLFGRRYLIVFHTKVVDDSLLKGTKAKVGSN